MTMRLNSISNNFLLTFTLITFFGAVHTVSEGDVIDMDQPRENIYMKSSNYDGNFRQHDQDESYLHYRTIVNDYLQPVIQLLPVSWSFILVFTAVGTILLIGGYIVFERVYVVYLILKFIIDVLKKFRDMNRRWLRWCNRKMHFRR